MEDDECGASDTNDTSSYYSSSYPESDVAEKVFSTILIITLVLVTILGVVGNALVILSLSIDSRKLGITSILLGSLAITDLCINVFYVPMEIRFLFSPEWHFGDFLCTLTGFLGVFAQSSSACMLLVISCERFLVILYPLTSRTMLTRRRTFIIVAACWVVSAGLAAFPASFKKVHKSPCSWDICGNNHTELQKFFFYFYALFVLYLLPLGGMAIANTCVIRALIKSSRYTKKLQSMKCLEKSVKYSTASRNDEATITEKPIYRNNNSNDVTTDEKSTVDCVVTSGTDEDPFPPVLKVKKTKVKRGHSSVAQRQRVAVMLLSVVVLYAVCWLPIFIFGAMVVLFGVPPHAFGMIIFEGFAKILYSSNSALNPIVYGFMSKNFRQRIIHGLSRLNFWSRRKRQANSFGSAYTLSTRNSAISQSNRQTRYSALSKA